MVCSIILPANAPIHQIVSSPQSSTEAAKKDACLRACKALHEIGALTDYLLPEDDKHVELSQELSDTDGSNEEDSRAELHEMLVPAVLKKPWTDIENSTFSCYYIEISPTPADREYRRFGLFMKEPLPVEAGKMKVDLCLARGRMVRSQLIPCGVTIFNKDEIAAAEMFQQMYLKIILDRHKCVPDYVSLENDDDYKTSSSTFYLLLPLDPEKHGRNSVDWALVRRCLSSPVFKLPCLHVDDQTPQSSKYLHLANGYFNLDDVVGSLVYAPYTDIFFFISDVFWETNGFSLLDDGSKNHVKHYKERYDIDLAYPDQPLLKAKQLFVLDNLLRKKKLSDEWREKEEHFIKLPPEACQLKVIGFSKDIGSSLSLLPSIMHRLENFLVAIELKEKLVDSFPEGAEVTADRILEALTTEKCSENFSLERLEVLGDAFLKFAVGRCLFLKHDALDEGQLTRKRSNIVNNSNLLKLSMKKRLQVYIRDQPFEPGQFFPFGRPCPFSCTKETQESIHSRDHVKNNDTNSEVRCSKCHHWLFNKTIADAIEALTGAFIVDSGFKAAAAFLNWVGIEVDVTLPKLDNICSASQRFLPLSDQIDINALENTLGCKFAHKGLLIQAFLHPSFNNSFGGCYQRLEFLGDAVLDYLITSYLYSVYPSLQPGHLTDLRSACVSNTSFADVAGKWSFHKFIICDSSVLCEAMAKYVNNFGRSGKERTEDKACPKALGDLVESVTGALYLDSGFDLKHVWKTILFLLDPIINISKLQLNPLREIYEFCLSYNWELQFSSLKKENKFTVEAKVIERNVSASATNISRKAAKRMAAKRLFECLKAQGYKMKSESLEEVLRKSEAREAKLIGYDETPSTQTAESTSKCKPISGSIELLHRKSPEIRVTQSIHRHSCRTDLPTTNLSGGSSVDSNGKGAVSTVSAKSRLYELCTANCWKPPVFECCEAGPSHLKEFTFKVMLEIEELPNEAFEFYGEPRARKEDASEQAAEAALFYLEHEGYVWDKERDK